MALDRPEVLVLGAGGVLGEAWMGGLLAGLHEAGFDARDCDHFVGTSAGSIVAAALAGGVDPRTRLEQIPEQPPASEEPGGGSMLSGAHASGFWPTLSPRKPRAATPMIVSTVFCTTSRLPITLGSRPKRRLQKSSLSTAYGAPPASSSARLSKNLPMRDPTPNTVK